MILQNHGNYLTVDMALRDLIIPAGGISSPQLSVFLRELT